MTRFGSDFCPSTFPRRTFFALEIDLLFSLLRLPSWSPPSRPQRRPRGLQEAPKRPQERPERPPEAPKRSQDPPKRLQEAPKSAPGGPKRASRDPKSRSRGLKTHSRAPKSIPRRPKGFSEAPGSAAVFGKFIKFKSRLQKASKTLKIADIDESQRPCLKSQNEKGRAGGGEPFWGGQLNPPPPDGSEQSFEFFEFRRV